MELILSRQRAINFFYRSLTTRQTDDFMNQTRILFMRKSCVVNSPNNMLVKYFMYGKNDATTYVVSLFISLMKGFVSKCNIKNTLYVKLMNVTFIASMTISMQG